MTAIFRGGLRWSWLLLAMVLILGTAGVPALVELRRPAETAVARGERRARELGCFVCHGQAGEGGVPNLLSETGTVPSFTARRDDAKPRSVAEQREIILDGASRTQRRDPSYRSRTQWNALHMPAYRGFLEETDLEDLLAYLAAAADTIVPPDPLARRGAELATRLACFDCHGPYGAGGNPNPGSFKGYIPGFWGKDFDELVRDDRELRAWIEAGEIDRIRNHPLGRRYLDRQRIKMPPFGQFLADDEIDALVAYVRWLHGQAASLFGGTT